MRCDGFRHRVVTRNLRGESSDSLSAWLALLPRFCTRIAPMPGVASCEAHELVFVGPILEIELSRCPAPLLRLHACEESRAFNPDTPHDHRRRIRRNYR